VIRGLVFIWIVLYSLPLFGRWISRTKNKEVRVLILKANRGLAEMAGLIESGRIDPVVDGPYPLGEVPAALKRFSQGRQKGRIVIAVRE